MRHIIMHLTSALIAWVLTSAICKADLEARSGLMGCAADGKFYVAGGASTTDGLSSRFDAWDPATQTWARLPDLPRPRGLGAMVTAGGSIYLIGGIGADNRTLTDIDVFDIEQNRWRLPIGDAVRVNRHAAVAIGEDIFVIGGIEEPQHGNPVVHGNRLRVFNTTTKAWFERAPMSIGRHGHAAAVFNGGIFVSGGYTLDNEGASAQSKSVESFDPTTDRWTTAPELQQPHAFHGMAAANERLIVFGTRGADLTTEILSAASQAWVKSPDMPVPRHRFAFAPIADRIIVFGGENEDGRATATFMIFDARLAQWTLKSSDSIQHAE